MCCWSIEDETIAVVYATHKNGMDKGQSSLTSKILSNMPYIVQLEKRGFKGHHGHVFIEPGPNIFSTDVTGAH